MAQRIIDPGPRDALRVINEHWSPRLRFRPSRLRLLIDLADRGYIDGHGIERTRLKEIAAEWGVKTARIKVILRDLVQLGAVAEWEDGRGRVLYWLILEPVET